MDINEVNRAGIIDNRHPWELSRTSCVYKAVGKYIENLHGDGDAKTYINVGAGDCYFDTMLLKHYKNDKLYAVDIGYKDVPSEQDSIYRCNYLEEIPVEKCDYAFMMDSLEYMEDDAGYVKSVSAKIKENGYFFFTLPAFPSLFSEHDIIVKNLRRYSRKSFENIINNIEGLEVIESYYFYTSLFLVRFMQKALKLKIDPDHKVTTGWEHDENSFMTKLVEGFLNLDFNVNMLISKIKIRLPGLSMLVVCKRT